LGWEDRDARDAGDGEAGVAESVRWVAEVNPFFSC
jgi:hypothetical protein